MSDSTPPIPPTLAAARDRIAAARERAKSNELRGALDDLSEVRVTLDRYEGDEHLADELRAAVATEMGLLHQRLGDVPEAITSLARAETLQRACLRRDANPRHRLQLATTLINASGMHARLQRFDAGLKMAEEALGLMEDVPAEVGAAKVVLTLGGLQNRATLELGKKEWAAAEATLKQSLALGEQLLANGGHQLLPQIVDATTRLCHLFRSQQRSDEALPIAEKAARWAEAVYEEGSPQGRQLYVNTQLQLVDVNFGCKRFAEAEDHLWKAVDVSGHPQSMLVGTGFYASLLRMEELDPSEGGLPRGEIVEAFDELVGKMEALSVTPPLLAAVRARYAVLVDGDVEGAEATLSELRGNPDHVQPVTKEVMRLLESDLEWKRQQNSSVSES